MRRQARILHAPTTVGGNPQGLSLAERKLGADSVSMCTRQNVYKYHADIVLDERNLNTYFLELKKWWFFFNSIDDYDIFHLNFGSSFSPPLFSHLSSTTKLRPFQRMLWETYVHIFEHKDLRLLRRAGKVIFVTYQGDDARQGDFCLKNFTVSIARELRRSYYSEVDDVLKRKAISAFAKYAHKIYSLNPDLLWVLPKNAEFVPYSHFDVRNCPVLIPSTGGPLRVAHAPTHRGAKGSQYILSAIERLVKEGHDIEPVVIEGLSHEEALEQYRRADILVDQVLAGWYGGVALEFMSMGKPVICYIRNSDLRFIPVKMREQIPVINAKPNTIYDVLKRVSQMGREELVSIGTKSREYALRWHDPTAIAQKVMADYQKALDDLGKKLFVTKSGINRNATIEASPQRLS